MGFPAGASSKEPTCQCKRHKICGFDPWVRKMPWRRAGQPTCVCVCVCVCIYIYIYILFQILFRYRIYKLLNIVPCAIQQVLITDLFYLQYCVSVNHKLLICVLFSFGNHMFIFYVCGFISVLQISSFLSFLLGFPDGAGIKNLPAMQKMWV